jgi:hypothetical protein
MTTTLYKPVLFINTNTDKNIWHVYMMELLEIGRLLNKKRTIEHMLLTNFDPSLPSDIWRLYILKHLVKNVYISENENSKHSDVKGLPRVATLYSPEILKIHFQWWDCWNPTKYTANKDIIHFVKYLQNRLNVDCTNTNKIKFINRRKTRQVFDKHTNKPLDEILQMLGIECCYFENKTPREQIEFVKDAGILISPHGSALTNIIFTADMCEIVEITNRKFWFCEPICEQHRLQKIPIHQPCRTNSPFPNYDFINMCKLWNKQHHEYSPYGYTDESCTHHMNRNIVVDSLDFIEFIHNILQKRKQTNS